MNPAPSAENSPPPRSTNVRSVRLRDIAALADVHVTTVSSVLSPRPGSSTKVSEKTASRIRQLAEQLNYRPHLHAQNMRKSKTGVVGLIEFGRMEVHSTRTTDLVHAVRKQGYEALTSNVLWYDETDESSGIKSAIDYVLGSRVEGLILIAPVAGMTPSTAYAIQEMGIPCVAFNGVHYPGVPQVRSDVFGGMKLLTNHLLALGHKRICLLSTWGTASKDENTCWPALERKGGFQAAIDEAGGIFTHSLDTFQRHASSTGVVGTALIEEAGLESPSHAERGYLATRRLIEAKVPVNAIICSNDTYAMGALRACYEAGVKVPQDIAVVGFAGESNTKYLCPALTTVDTIASGNTDVVVDLLFKIIRGEQSLREGLPIKLPCQLIVRESCGANL